MTDRITRLCTVSGARLTKLWRGTADSLQIEGYQDAKTFEHYEHPVSSIAELADTLGKIRLREDCCVIRGVYPPNAEARVLRNTESTFDEPHHWCMLDVDGYEPICSDPVREPEAACQEFILDRLPKEFHDRSFYWQLSSSAGAPGKEATLKAHLWFWLSEKCDSVALRTWAKAHGHVDPAVFRQVQPHYTADPLFDGVEDPVPRRAGLVEGICGDTVDVAFLGTIVPNSGTTWRDGSDIDLGKIKGAVPDYDIERVRDEVLAHLDPNMHHDEWVAVGMSLHHQFDGSPEALDLWDEWSSDGASWNEDVCAERWRSFKVDRMAGTGAVTLGSLIKKVRPQVQEALQAEQPGAGRGDTVLASLAYLLGKKGDQVKWFESAVSWSSVKFEDTLMRMAWEPSRGRFTIVPPEGSIVESAREDLGYMLHERGLMGFYDAAALEEIAAAAALPGGSAVPQGQSWSATKTAEFMKEVLGKPLERLRKLTMAHRQFTSTTERVDLFCETGRTTLKDRVLTLVFPHEELPAGPVDARLIADYKQHFPQLDDFLELLLAARLANDRKRAHLWLHAESNWGKGFLSGMLQRLGLVCHTTIEELTNAIGGSPSGMTPDLMRRSWVLAVDEFKGVTRELKQLGTELSFAPKNRARVTVPLYLKLFMSAEEVPSLVGEDTGADVQFINRFMRMRLTGVLDERGLYQADNAAYGAAVRNYIAGFVNQRVAEARKTGEAPAASRADAALARLHAKYPLSTEVKASLDDRLPDILADFIADMAAPSVAAASPIQRIARNWTFLKDGVVYLQRPEKALGDWIQESFSRSEAGKVAYKKGVLLKMLGEAKAIRDQAGRVRRGVRLCESTAADEAFMG